MKFRIILVLAFLSMQVFAFETNVFHGGDDAGNGGFAYKQSIKILELAANDLEHKIIESDIKELVDHPERKVLMQNTLSYDHLQKLYKTNKSRKGRVLAMDYVVNPPAVKILNPYYVAFMGKTDSELDQSVLEVEKRLLHEVSHIWGYNEKKAEEFSITFLKYSVDVETRPTRQLTAKNICVCKSGRSDIGNSLECENICWNKPYSNSAILYLDFLVGDEIAKHPKLRNLYSWCNQILEGDVTSPLCILKAVDGLNKINNIPVSIELDENSLTANLDLLAYDRNYVLSLHEIKTGSNAQSNEFALKREKDEINRGQIGESCQSDHDCNSLCCNQSTGSCALHDPNGRNPVYCAKEYGQSCASKEFCKIEDVQTCKIVKSGLRPDGSPACTMRCPAVATFGDCLRNICVPPQTPPIPTFDPNDCSNAVDP